jgi:hypothetical protein
LETEATFSESGLCDLSHLIKRLMLICWVLLFLLRCLIAIVYNYFFIAAVMQFYFIARAQLFSRFVGFCGFQDFCARFFQITPASDFYPLAFFQVFVVLKEVFDLLESDCG